jgi:malonate-semialdehyde dehydrogenase (acetylating)/methylmalonate-semialdehyde dehydrogenase
VARLARERQGLPEAKAEVEKGIECIEYGCSLPNLASGNQLEVSRGVACEVTYEPLGVVAGVTPFNFPCMVPFWMIPQALVGGNAFILKPSEQVPLSSMRIAEMLKLAGLPDGVFNIVQGGREVVEALCDHPAHQGPRLRRVDQGRQARLRAGVLHGQARALPRRREEPPHRRARRGHEPHGGERDGVVHGCAGQRCMAASVLLAVGEVDHIIDAVVSAPRR